MQSFALFALMAAGAMAAPAQDKRANVVVVTEMATVQTTITAAPVYVTATAGSQAAAEPVQVEAADDSVVWVTETAKAVTVTADAATSQAAAQETSQAIKTVTSSWSDGHGGHGYRWSWGWTSTLEASTTSAAQTSQVVVSTQAPEAVTTTSKAQEPTTATTSQAAATSQASTSTGDEFADACLEGHNSVRAKHFASALTWNQEMADYAKTVSSTCVFKHSGGNYGENLAAGYDSAASAIQAWYDENTLYDYSAGQFGETTGHFTQVVWKDATQVGCATVTCDGSNGTPGDFLTCEYDTGNVIGYFLKNVCPESGCIE